MNADTRTAEAKAKPGRTDGIILYLLIAAECIRIWTSGEIREPRLWYLGLQVVYLILFTTVLWHSSLSPLWAHLYLTVQSALILGLIALNPAIEHVNVFFIPLSYQVPFLLNGRTRWTWIGIFVVLTGGSLMFFRNGVEGLAMGLTAIATIVVVSAFVSVNQEIERARAESEAMLAELRATHARLEAYANQVEELAAAEERNRLARELHDSVSQTMFGITLTARTIQVLVERNPAQVKPQLERLQALTQNALAQMRSLIAELRPQSD